jgi:hypothetical protein
MPAIHPDPITEAEISHSSRAHEHGDRDGTKPTACPSPVTARRHIDLVKLQQEADELSKIAQTIPADVTSVRHDMLPKDVLDKLKRIEKLSKHLRSELAP